MTCDAYAIFSLLIAFSHDSGGVITFMFPHISYVFQLLFNLTHV
jgi:hypothetical protein